MNKKYSGFNLTPVTRILLEKLSAYLGLSMTGVIESAVREFAHGLGMYKPGDTAEDLKE